MAFRDWEDYAVEAIKKQQTGASPPLPIKGEKK